MFRVSSMMLRYRILGSESKALAMPASSPVNGFCSDLGPRVADQVFVVDSLWTDVCVSMATPYPTRPFRAELLTAMHTAQSETGSSAGSSVTVRTRRSQGATLITVDNEIGLLCTQEKDKFSARAMPIFGSYTVFFEPWPTVPSSSLSGLGGTCHHHLWIRGWLPSVVDTLLERYNPFLAFVRNPTLSITDPDRLSRVFHIPVIVLHSSDWFTFQ